jgi:hypothetical protein
MYCINPTLQLFKFRDDGGPDMDLRLRGRQALRFLTLRYSLGGLVEGGDEGDFVPQRVVEVGIAEVGVFVLVAAAE